MKSENHNKNNWTYSFTNISIFCGSVNFPLIFGEGGQASQTLNNGLNKLVMYILPLFIIGGISYRMFKRK